MIETQPWKAEGLKEATLNGKIVADLVTRCCWPGARNFEILMADASTRAIAHLVISGHTERTARTVVYVRKIRYRKDDGRCVEESRSAPGQNKRLGDDVFGTVIVIILDSVRNSYSTFTDDNCFPKHQTLLSR